MEETLACVSRFLHTKFRGSCKSESFRLTNLGRVVSVSHGVTHTDNSRGIGLGCIYITRVGQDDFRACFAFYSTMVDVGRMGEELRR